MSSRFDLREYVHERLGVRMVTRGGHGDELVCTCPWCDGREKLYVNPARGLWTCYRCGEGGGIVRLVAKVDGLAWRDALRFVVEAAVRLPSRPLSALALDDADDDDAPPPPRPALELPPEFRPIFDGRTWCIPHYLRERRLRARTAAAYGVGFCEAGRYASRLILPAHVEGELAFFQARSMTGRSPKYLAPVVDRSGVLWGYDEAIGADRIFVVEGPIDVLGMAQAGFSAVGLMGKVISLRQAALVALAGASRVTLMLDPEARREAADVARVLSEVVDRVDLAQLPAGVDPGDAPAGVIKAAAADARPPGLRDRFAPR